MRPRSLLLFLLLVCCVGFSGLWLVDRISRRPGITRESYARIQSGMTRAEVEGILDGPEDDLVTEDRDIWSGPMPPGGKLPPVTWHRWIGQEAVIRIEFNVDGRVGAIRYSEAPVTPLLDRLLALFPR